jgi:hypothetical protein
MSFGVFKSTIEALSEITVPSGPLDRRVLHQLSGAAHGALMSGLSFLGYVDDERRATNTYRQLVESSKNEAEFKKRLLEVVSDKYAPIIGDVDLDRGTMAELEKAFKTYGVPQGQMLTKTIRFYVKVLQECGASLSPHIANAKPRAPQAKVKKPEKSRQSGGSTHHTGETQTTTPKGFERMPVPGLPEAFIQYPLNVTEAHCDLFDAVVKVLRVLAKGRAAGREDN